MPKAQAPESFVDMLQTPFGSILVSVILGLGIAALFRKACKDNRCVVIQGPPADDVGKFYYKIDHDCYKYTPVASQCKDQ
jgi:hypothetical protein